MKDAKNKALHKAKGGKRESMYTHTREKTSFGERHGVYHQEKGDMKVMGLGSKGAKRAKEYISKH